MKCSSYRIVEQSEGYDMLKIELIPDFTHCIETVARREYADVSKQLLTPGRANKGLREKLEILRLFLETANFRKLRCECEEQMMEGRSVHFVIYLENSVPKYEMQVKQRSFCYRVLKRQFEVLHAIERVYRLAKCIDNYTSRSRIDLWVVNSMRKLVVGG
jgi:hypothetical protein